MSRRSSNRVNAKAAASQLSPVGVDGHGINAAALGPPNTVAANDVLLKTEPGLIDAYAPYSMQHMTSSLTRNGPGIHTPPQTYVRVDDMRSRNMPKDLKSSALSMSDHNDEGDDQIFGELLSANPGDAFVTSSPSSYLHAQPIPWRDYQNVVLPKVIKLAPPQPTRSALYEVGAAYFSHSSPEDASQASEMTVQQLDHELPEPYSPFETDPVLTAVQFDPSELPPEQRNPNGINWIVQSVEHGYALMRHLEARRQQHPPDTSSSGGPPIDTNNGATDKGANDTGSEVRSAGPYSTKVEPGSMENVVPNGWNPSVDSSSGSWPKRESPVRSSAVPQGWHMSPQAQTKEPVGMQPPASATRPYFAPPGWSQPLVASAPVSQADKALPRSSSIPPDPREGSWPHPGEGRPPSATGMRWGAHPQGPPAPPASGAAPNPQQQPWQSMRSIAANPSGPTYPYHPHPDIDGRADDGTRWATKSTVHSLAWDPSRGPGPTNESAPSGYPGGDPSGGSRAQQPPPTQQSPTTWSPTRSASAPWVTEGGHPLPPDGRRLPPDATLRTPSTQPTTAASQQQQHVTYTGVPMYLSHGGQQQQQQQQQSQQSQPHQQPPQPNSGMGREMRYGPQPDSLGGYLPSSIGPPQPVQRAHSVSVPAGMAHQPMRYPLSAPTGPGGPGGPVAGMESRNPYPAIPPATGAISYGTGPPQPGATGISQQSRSTHPLHAQPGVYHSGPSYIPTHTSGGPPPPGGDPASAVGGPRVGASPYGQPGWPATSVPYMINPAQQHAGAATPGPTRPPSVGMQPPGQYMTTMGAHPSQVPQEMYGQLQYRGHAPQ